MLPPNGEASHPHLQVPKRAPRPRTSAGNLEIAVKLTETNVAKLKLNAGQKDRIVFDDTVPGFGIRLRASGQRTWLYQYKLGGRTRRLPIGSASVIRTGAARDIAVTSYTRIDAAATPHPTGTQQVQRSLNTFGWLSEQFLASYKALRRTLDEVHRHSKKSALPLHGTPIDTLSRRHIADLLGKIEASSGAVTRTGYAAAYRRCSRGECPKGSSRAIRQSVCSSRQETPRDRVLSDDELKRVWLAANNGDFGIIVRLLIFTAECCGEIAGLLLCILTSTRGFSR